MVEVFMERQETTGEKNLDCQLGPDADEPCGVVWDSWTKQDESPRICREDIDTVKK